jgi:hypothetical protein
MLDDNIPIIESVTNSGETKFNSNTIMLNAFAKLETIMKSIVAERYCQNGWSR